MRDIPSLNINLPADKQAAQASHFAFVTNITTFYAALVNIGWPEELCTVPPVPMEGETTFHPNPTKLRSVTWFGAIREAYDRVCGLRELTGRSGQSLSCPTVLDDEWDFARQDLDNSTFPALRIIIGDYSQTNRSASNVRREEMLRLALSYLYQRPMPAEAVKVVLSQFSLQYTLYNAMMCYFKLIRVLLVADATKHPSASRAGSNRAHHCTRSTIARHFEVIARENGKSRVHRYSMMAFVNRNLAAGRPANQGAPLARVVPGQTYEGPREPAPKFNSKALEDAVATISSICVRHGVRLLDVLANPDILYARVGATEQGDVPEVYAGEVRRASGMGGFRAQEEATVKQAPIRRISFEEALQRARAAGPSAEAAAARRPEPVGGAPVRKRLRTALATPAAFAEEDPRSPSTDRLRH